MSYVCSCGEKYHSNQGRIDCEISHASRKRAKSWDRCLYCDASIKGDDALVASLHDPYCPHGKSLAKLANAAQIAAVFKNEAENLQTIAGRLRDGLKTIADGELGTIEEAMAYANTLVSSSSTNHLEQP